MKGGNFIHSDWLSRAYGLSFFKKFRIPIIMMGAGIQSIGNPIRLSKEEISILELIHTSSACSSVRERRTAEALARIGIKNTIVTGCPTLFWEQKPALSIHTKRNPQKMGFIYREHLYQPGIRYLRKQWKIIAELRQQYKLPLLPCFSPYAHSR